jgi:SAM-dependent methyltransferase
LAGTELFADLREALRRAGYTSDRVERLLYAEDAAPGTPLEITVGLRRVRGDSPLQTLTRLFRLRASVTSAAARAAFAPVGLEPLAATGVIDLAGTEVCSTFDLREYDGCFFVGDRNRTEREDLPANYVTGVNATSLALASLTIRRPVEAALDLGTGNGIQAVLAARHARRVVAVDLNPRALNLAAFNTGLNGRANVECRQGSFFDPVAGERFDLIVANPPFVISPEARYIFRDGGQPGDALSQQIARRTAESLREGGFGHLLCNWAFAPDGDWAEPLRNWLDGTGCDVMALLYHTEDPLSYAAKWLRPQCLAQPDSYGEAIDRWLSYYEDRGIRAIATGGLVLRRRGVRANWFQPYEVPHQGHASCGDQLHRLFQIHDYLQAVPAPEALLGRPLRLVREHGLEQRLQYDGDGYLLRECRLRLNQPLAFRGGIDLAGLQLLARCDGKRPLGELLRDLARDQEVNQEELTASCLPKVRALMLMGFLIPSDLDG